MTRSALSRPRSGSFSESGNSAAWTRRHYLIALLILVVALGLRVWQIEADPPIDLSSSNDVYTDPSQYTLFGRQMVERGEFNPYHDSRFAVFQKSLVTLVGTAVFWLAGVGHGQANLVGVLFSFGAIVLFGLFLKRIAGPLATLLFLAFAAVDYNLVFYGRLPFLEHAMIFMAFAALVLATYGRTIVAFGLAGICLGSGILFGKVLGMVFLFPFALFLFYRLRHGDTALPQISWRHQGSFAGGFAIVLIAWVFFTWLPMRSQVAGYLQEQTISLYGAPEGLESIESFLFQMVTFGVFSRLVPRTMVPAILAAMFLGAILFHVARGQSWKEGFGRWNAGHLFIAAMTIGYFGALMIWNYRPLRYQLPLTFGFLAGAAILLERLWYRWRPTLVTKTPLLFLPLCLVVVFVPVFQVSGLVMEQLGIEFYFSQSKYVMLGFTALLVGLVYWLIERYRQNRIPYRALLARGFVILAGLWVVGVGLYRYGEWAGRATFGQRDMARDLKTILSPEAVISGPYAPVLTLGTHLGTVIHMFGVSEPDPTLFRRFPITHLLVDDANESRARLDYKPILDNSRHLMSYVIGSNKIRLLRVAGSTEHPMASGYPLSLFEQAVEANREGDSLGYARAMSGYLRSFPENSSGYMYDADILRWQGRFEAAEQLVKKAIEFSPTSYVFMTTLARWQTEQFRQTADLRYKQEALATYDRAIRLAPTVEPLVEARRNLSIKEAWQLLPDTTL